MKTAAWTWRPGDEGAYSYLLGMYLGDGCISVRRQGGTNLRVSLDSHYPSVVAECQEAIQRTLPGCRVTRRHPPGEATVVLSACASVWPQVFPQHGPGPKHTRPIKLTPWQREIVDRHPRELLRGLLHSDGCRTVNRFRTRLPSGRTATYAYPRYFFSNLSPDIRALFCDYCDALGIRWTQSNARNISVAHRDSVSVLDLFVGPKR